MNAVSTERTMTIPEVSTALKVSRSTIERAIRELYPNLMRNGFTTRLNEIQVTEIKKEICKNPHLVQSDEVTTDLEMAQKTVEVMAWLHHKVEEETEKRKEAERKNAVLMHVSKTYTASEIAKELGMRSAQELNQELEHRGIQYYQNGTWVPRADYAQLGYFDIKQDVLDNGRVIYYRRITQDGRAFILELFKKLMA
jgi:transposase